MDERFAAAVAGRDVRPMGGDVGPDRTLLDLDGASEVSGPEHGMRGERTLCGLPRDEVIVLRHLWSPDGPGACSSCRAVPAAP